MSRLNGKVILVTGGNGLLGKEIISKITSEGGFCINLDVNHETTPDLSSIKCDITLEESVNDCISQITSTYKQIDGLVNNAYPRTSDWGKKFEDISLESWRQNVDWQLNSYFYMSQQIAKQMTFQRSGGSIVNMASVYGSVGPDFSVYEGTEMTMPAAYSAIKGGLINFTRYMASYFGHKNIRVNVVSPGGIFDKQNPIFVKNYEAKVPMKRMGSPADIAPSIIFLLSDDSSYITGQNINVDGGWTCI